MVGLRYVIRIIVFPAVYRSYRYAVQKKAGFTGKPLKRIHIRKTYTVYTGIYGVKYFLPLESLQNSGLLRISQGSKQNFNFSSTNLFPLYFIVEERKCYDREGFSTIDISVGYISLLTMKQKSAQLSLLAFHHFYGIYDLIF